MSSFITDVTASALAKCLDGVGARHKAIANNIANVETPGFTRSEVSFEDQLKEAFHMAGSETDFERMLSRIEPEVRPDVVSPARPNGNNVSIDKEMADLTKNTLRYEAVIQLLNLKGAMVRTAINEGRR